LRSVGRARCRNACGSATSAGLLPFVSRPANAGEALVRPAGVRPPRRVLLTPATKQDGPLFAWTGGEGELRNVSKPIAYDKDGNPLYAPRGVRFRLW
jgi:hypothetical protein